MGSGAILCQWSLKKKISAQGEHQDRDIIATIRPEEISIKKEKNTAWLEGTVYSVLPAGSETIITVKRDSLDLTLKMNGFSNFQVDDKVWMDFSSDQMNYFDPESQKLLDIAL